MNHITHAAHLANKARRKNQKLKTRTIVAGIPEAEQREKDVETFREASQGIDLLGRMRAWLRKVIGS